ncbi:RNA-directed DNA polymerase from mobile element jockey [Elysia marginata]|uniref:RNA-directed DNA polymerase from mobile element jockey n=1 Tax=Elysia marginata TaxID=1093978 RepID=A0AAV4FAP8_9GAST|nr:RNA-directed DNA polymerase from mobile element jockey [Elysia marginata]
MESTVGHPRPLKTRIITDRPSAPWMTSHIKELKTERRRAERKWRSTNLCIHKEIYRDLNRKLKNAIETAKKYFYCYKIEECVTSKALYNVANTLSGKGGSSSQGSIPQTIPADQLAERFAAAATAAAKAARSGTSPSSHRHHNSNNINNDGINQ